MKRMIAVFIAVAGLATAETARAGWGGTVTPAGGSGGGMSAPEAEMTPGAAGPEQTGPHTTLMSYASSPGVVRPPDKYGFLPAFKNIFRKKSACDDCNGHSHGHRSTGIYQAGPAVNTGLAPQQGTLAYPNHPYVRGPRDFFMWGN